MSGVRVLLACATPLATAIGFYLVACDVNHMSSSVDAAASNDAAAEHARIPYDGLAAGDATPRIPVHAEFVAALPGASAFDKLRARMQVLIAATGADVSQFAKLPAPSDNPLNDFGFPGLWPNLDPYRSFEVTMAPSRQAAVVCITQDGGSVA